MRATLLMSRRATYGEYLATERASATRHEFIDGVIVAMAGGSDEHNAIASRFGGLCMLRLAGACRHYTPDQRFFIPTKNRGRYADGSIICGPPQHPQHDDQATINPRVVIEVLSPSSEDDDEGDKRRDFQSLPSLEAYVVAAQDARRVSVYRRDARGQWGLPVVYREGEEFELPALSSPIAVADLYAGVIDTDGRSLIRTG